jgi:hypothetical protein
MRQPTTTLTVSAPSVALDLGDAYDLLLTEDGLPLLTEDGLELYCDQFAVKVVLTMLAPSVALDMKDTS